MSSKDEEQFVDERLNNFIKLFNTVKIEDVGTYINKIENSLVNSLRGSENETKRTRSGFASGLYRQDDGE